MFIWSCGMENCPAVPAAKPAVAMAETTNAEINMESSNRPAGGVPRLFGASLRGVPRESTLPWELFSCRPFRESQPNEPRITSSKTKVASRVPSMCRCKNCASRATIFSTVIPARIRTASSGRIGLWARNEPIAHTVKAIAHTATTAAAGQARAAGHAAVAEAMP